MKSRLKLSLAAATILTAGLFPADSYARESFYNLRHQPPSIVIDLSVLEDLKPRLPFEQAQPDDKKRQPAKSRSSRPNSIARNSIKPKIEQVVPYGETLPVKPVIASAPKINNTAKPVENTDEEISYFPKKGSTILPLNTNQPEVARKVQAATSGTEVRLAPDAVIAPPPVDAPKLEPAKIQPKIELPQKIAEEEPTPAPSPVVELPPPPAPALLPAEKDEELLPPPVPKASLTAPAPMPVDIPKPPAKIPFIEVKDAPAPVAKKPEIAAPQITVSEAPKLPEPKQAEPPAPPPLPTPVAPKLAEVPKPEASKLETPKLEAPKLPTPAVPLPPAPVRPVNDSKEMVALPPKPADLLPPPPAPKLEEANLPIPPKPVTPEQPNNLTAQDEKKFEELKKRIEEESAKIPAPNLAAPVAPNRDEIKAAPSPQVNAKNLPPLVITQASNPEAVPSKAAPGVNELPPIGNLFNKNPTAPVTSAPTPVADKSEAVEVAKLEEPTVALPPPPPPMPGKPSLDTVVSQPAEIAETAPASKADLTIIYGEAEINLPTTEKTALEKIITQLNAGKNGSVIITSYASGTPEQASRAKQTSLHRALEVRKYLMDRNISSEKIEIKPLGNKSAGGVPDRVDVVVK